MEIKDLVEMDHLKDFPLKTKGFQNLFDDVTLKYWIFQGNTTYWLTGLTPYSSADSIIPPFLPIGSLLSQLELIARSIFSQKYDEPNIDLPDLKEAVKDVEVFLVIKDVEGQEHKVKNLFKNGEETIKEIPTSLCFSEGNGFDALGKYESETGSIYLWVDKIYGFYCNQLLFQSVLLHELLHLLFDVMRKKLDLKTSTGIDEETLDNCLMLYCYSQTLEVSKENGENAYLQIRSFVNSQSGVYSAAGPMFDKMKTWSDMRTKIISFFQM